MIFFNPIHQGAPYVIPADKVLTRIVGGEIVRIPIKAELKTLEAHLEASPANDLRVRSLVAWHTGFSRALRLPNQTQVVKEFVQELVKLLRDPPGILGIERPFPPELFGDRPMPIIRYLVEKMRDKRSLFYSEAFDEEAVRVLAAPRPAPLAPPANLPNDPGIPPELLEQLRQIEAGRARQVQIEGERLDGLHALQGRIRQREANLQANIDRVAEQHLQQGLQIREEAERVRLADLEQRALMLEGANRLRQEAEELRLEAARLQHHLDINQQRIGELEGAAIQLQVELNNTKAQIADNKSNWIVDVFCIAASVAVSWTLQMPVTITL